MRRWNNYDTFVRDVNMTYDSYLYASGYYDTMARIKRKEEERLEKARRRLARAQEREEKKVKRRLNSLANKFRVKVGKRYINAGAVL